ncbi:MAG: MFS transporter [Firmicutes bacterium]|nr:MFS transporter [Bacillota bacterium]
MEGAARRTLWLLSVCQFLMSSVLWAFAPILPVDLAAMQGAPASPAALSLWSGAILGANFLAAAVMAPVWGRLTDRIGPKWMLIRAGVAETVFTALMAFANAPWQLLLLRIGLGLFAGYAVAATAWVSLTTPRHKVGLAMGVLSAGQSAGITVAPLLGELFWAWSHQVATSLLAIAGLAALALGWTVLGIPQVPPRPAAESLWSRPEGLKPYRALVFVALVAQAALTAVVPVATTWTAHLQGTSLEEAVGGAAAALAITGVVGALCAPLAGRAIDAVGSRRVLLLAFLGAAGCLGVQALTTRYAVFLGARALLGLFTSAIFPSVNATVARMTRRQERGAAYGLTTGGIFFGNATGPVVGGILAGTLGVQGLLASAALWLGVLGVFSWFAWAPTERAGQAMGSALR